VRADKPSTAGHQDLAAHALPAGIEPLSPWIESMDRRLGAPRNIEAGGKEGTGSETKTKEPTLITRRRLLCAIPALLPRFLRRELCHLKNVGTRRDVG
jgi:hypothetical protein